MLRIAVCDDETEMCEQLKEKLSQLLKHMNEKFQISCYTQPVQLLNSISEFQLIYLDIQMPGLDGVTLARKIRERTAGCILIFITVLKECMLEAFEVEALDYICKPVDEKRLENSLKRALRHIRGISDKTVFVHSANWCKSVKISTVIYCEVMNRKIYLHTNEGVIDYYGKLEDVEKQLDYRFFKCHRSYLVNLDYLQEYANGRIILQNKEQIPVSRLRHRELMAKMLQYMKAGE